MRLLPHRDRVLRDAQATLVRKAELCGALRTRGYAIHEGSANFFLLQAGPRAPELCAHLRDQRVLVRDRSGTPETAGMVRISVGSSEENAALLRALDAWSAG
jgi:histidinol-phosphate/aromatic aminotransferase/cobyric acid decarboxylase-like protein